MDRYEFDDDYVRRLLAGDRQTVEHFYGYFTRQMQLKLRRDIRSPAAIEDITQTTLARVFEKLPTLRDGGALGSFVMKFCRNVLLEHFRDENRFRRTDGFAKAPSGEQKLIEEEMIDEESYSRVRRILDRMDEREANILRDLWLEELSREQVCRKFNVDAQYLRVLICRAKKSFRQEFRRKSTPDLKKPVTPDDSSSPSL